MKYKNIPLLYLASPYTHPDKKVMNRRAKEVTECAIKLLLHDIFTFCPISYNSPWSRSKWTLPHEWTFWEKFDCVFLSRCNGIVVVTLDGWDKSVGVLAELEYAKKLKIPDYYISYEDIINDKLDGIKEFETQIRTKKSRKRKKE